MRATLIAIALAAATAATQIHAAVVALDFSGTELGGGILTGTARYDTGLPNTSPTPTTSGIYFGASMSLSISGGPQDGGSIMETNARVTVVPSNGLINIFANPSTGITRLEVVSFSPGITSTALPNAAELQAFVNNDLIGPGLFVQDTQVGLPFTTTFSGEAYLIDSLTVREVAPVPLPAGVLLLLGGLGALTLTARRRRPVPA